MDSVPGQETHMQQGKRTRTLQLERSPRTKGKDSRVPKQRSHELQGRPNAAKEKKTPDSSGAGEHAVLMTTIEPLPLTAFSQALELKVFLLDLSLCPLCFTQVLPLQVLLRIYSKVSLFWLGPCSILEYSFGTLL